MSRLRPLSLPTLLAVDVYCWLVIIPIIDRSYPLPIPTWVLGWRTAMPGPPAAGCKRRLQGPNGLPYRGGFSHSGNSPAYVITIRCPARVMAM